MSPDQRENMSKATSGALVSMILVLGMLVAHPLLASGQTAATDKGTLKVSISTDPKTPMPKGQTKIKIDFVNPQTNAIQEHIDYTVSIAKDAKSVFGPIPLTHTSPGTVTIPVAFKENGKYQVTVDVQGILFQPIPSEKAVITLNVGQVASDSSKAKDTKQEKVEKKDAKKSADKKSDKEKKKSESDKKPLKKPKPKTS
jgi:thiol:disulfide interchange protein